MLTRKWNTGWNINKSFNKQSSKYWKERFRLYIPWFFHSLLRGSFQLLFCFVFFWRHYNFFFILYRIYNDINMSGIFLSERLRYTPEITISIWVVYFIREIETCTGNNDINMIGIFTVSNHLIGAYTGGPTVTQGIHQSSNQTSRTVFLKIYYLPILATIILVKALQQLDLILFVLHDE